MAFQRRKNEYINKEYWKAKPIYFPASKNIFLEKPHSPQILSKLEAMF